MSPANVTTTKSDKGLEVRHKKDFKELKTCSVKISINLDQVSKKLSPKVLAALEKAQGEDSVYEKEIKFFIPQNYRTSDDEKDDAGKILALTLELEEWFDCSFGHLFVAGYKEKVVQHGISLVYCPVPSYTVDSIPFKLLSCCLILAAIGDDWMDSLKVEDGGFAARLETIKHFGAMMGDVEDTMGIQDLNQIVNHSELSTMDMLTKEPVLAALYDGFTLVQELLEEWRPKSSNNLLGSFKQTFMRYLQSDAWSKDRCKENIFYSIETSRHFRQIQAVLEFYIPTLGLVEDLELSQNIRNHAVFIIWKNLAGKIDGIQNDVLGAQKDLRVGEEDGILFQQVRRGLSFRDALDEELNLLSELSSDYVNLRRSLLRSFGEDEKFQRYVDVVDSILYGNFQTYVGSHKYGMQGQIHINHMSEA